ncbi:hypothetical protein HMPREF0971_02918 [Segatella oris F0302]|uniref:Fibronectin type III domain protein n=1 Tax=Segatella oris F0302 TaxID=649760 RepID=D1QVE0_9BACT|nr:hypothetical protein [Segatella oris]EFB30661.1 hypothetical protein HMPREF0971_02918 [Segatella oris F0302]MBF1449066.1 hypothetical protein [Segatella oris]
MKKQVLTLGIGLLSATLLNAQTSPWPGHAVGNGGEFYLYNVATGLWLQNNNTVKDGWATAVNVGTRGLPITLEKTGPKTFKLRSTFRGGNGVSNKIGDAGLLYWDMPAENVGAWDISPADNFQSIHGYWLECDAMVLGADNNLLTTDKDKNSVWQLVTREERIADAKAKASVEHPVDVTWLIDAPDLATKNTTYKLDFTAAPHAEHSTYQGGWNIVKANTIQEFWNTQTFDYHQTINGLPNGTYKFSVRGYYRDGSSETRDYTMYGYGADKFANGTEQLRATYYANGTSAPIMSLYAGAKTAPEEGFSFQAEREKDQGSGLYVPNTPHEANYALWKGNYQNAEITVTVTDGTLKFGVRKEAGVVDDWCVISDFSLKYLGSKVLQTAEEALKGLKAIIATTKAFKGAVAPALNKQYTEAIQAADKALTSTDPVAINTATSALQKAYDAVAACAENYEALAKTVEICKTANKNNDTQFSTVIAEAENVAKTATADTDMKLALVNLRVARKIAAADKLPDIYKGAAAGAGEFYFYNIASQKFLMGGSDWNTHAAVDIPGVLFTVTAEGDGFTINRFGGKDGNYLGYNGYTDIPGKDVWAFIPVAGKKNVYNIVKGDNHTQGLAFAPQSNTDADEMMDKEFWNTVSVEAAVAKNANAEWKLVTKAERDALLTTATETRPVDATHLLASPGFNRPAMLEGWITDNRSDFKDANLGVIDRGRRTNPVCEAYYQQMFEVNQVVSNLSEGYYQVNMTGYYRDGSREDLQQKVANGTTPARHAMLYIEYKGKGNEVALPSIAAGINQCPGIGWKGAAGEQPDNVMDAAEYFESGLYKVYTRIIKVGPEGELTIGVTKDKQVDNDWAVFDNFRLTYFGKHVSQEIIDGINTVKSNSIENGKIYNLQGMEVKRPLKRGIYICNGKKFIVK